MTAQDVLPAKRETLNIRIKPEERSMIDRVAKLRGKNRTDFVLEAARVAAEEACCYMPSWKRLRRSTKRWASSDHKSIP